MCNLHLRSGYNHQTGGIGVFRTYYPKNFYNNIYIQIYCILTIYNKLQQFENKMYSIYTFSPTV